MNELRQAIRLLLRHAGFTLTAVLTLGLGIGLVATQYSLIDGVLLRPLPYAEAERIYHVARAGEGGDGAWAPLAIDEFAAQREQQGSFERLAAFRSETYNLVSGREPPQRLWGSAVSSDFFEILRVRPLLGAPSSPARIATASRCARCWAMRYGAMPSAPTRPCSAAPCGSTASRPKSSA